MSKLPPLAAVRAFEAAARLQNFSRAGEELGMTQAAVSYQIRQLEQRLGRALFVREKGRVRLSETGQRLLPAISNAFATMGDAFAALGSDEADVLYKCSHYYIAETEAGLAWNDPDVAVPWPVATPLLSARDQGNATLRASFPERFNG